MPGVMNTLRELLIEEMQDILHAEKQLVKALPKMAKAAQSPKLKAGFEEHLEQTKGQVVRLEQAFQALGEKAKTKKCHAMEGLVMEGEELIKEEDESPVRDAGLIAGAQKVEHYEIATYGTLCTWAKLLGENEALKLLKATLDEEETTDKKLSKLAETAVNKDALG